MGTDLRDTTRMDTAEACRLADSIETRNRFARDVHYAALPVHIDPAHALARNREELGRVKGRRVDWLWLWKRLLGERPEIQIDALRRQLVVAGNRCGQVRRGHTHRGRELLEGISCHHDARCLVHEATDFAEILPTGKRHRQPTLPFLVE